MRVLKTVSVMAVSAIFLTGCIDSSPDDEEAQSLTIEEEDGVTTVSDIGVDGGEVNMGTDLEIPESFPKDIPIPDDASVFETNEILSEVSIVFHTAILMEEHEEIYTAYLESANYLNIQVEERESLGPYITITAEKEDESFYLSMQDDIPDTDGLTAVNIVVDLGE